MKSYFIGKALTELSFGSEWTYIDNDLSTLVYNNEPAKRPTEKEILDKAAELEKAEIAKLQAKATARTSALAKLAELGLTADEIAAL